MVRTFAIVFCLIALLEISLAQWQSVYSLSNRSPYGKCCGGRIVGGEEIDIRKVPYQAALLSKDFYFCGGVIISENYVLTGAHCILFFYNRLGSDDHLFVRVGSNSTNKDGIRVQVKETLCHGQFNFDNYDYDICLLELSEPLKFSETIQPVKLADKEPVGGEIGRVSGWGTLWENGQSPDKLQSVTVPVTNKTYCFEVYKNVSPVTERMICAGSEGRDSCQGDSGGGLVIDDDLLVGIISTGYGCGAKNFPGVYTSVGHPEIRKFIKGITQLHA